jgi:hypothetical protein
MMPRAARIPYGHLLMTGKALTGLYADAEKVATLMIHDRGIRSVVGQRSLNIMKAIDELREALMPAARQWVRDDDHVIDLLYGRDIRHHVVAERRDQMTGDLDIGPAGEDV